MPEIAPAGTDESAAFGTYAVKLPVFEGPLDLLLHLIRQAEVDVTDIPIAEIAHQYVEYLTLMDELNLDVAGEYLVMAATLAWIKSRMILPPPEGQEDEEGVDPRAELVARLLEYQRFKEVSEALGEAPRLDRDVFAGPGEEFDPTPEAEREIKVGIVQLLDAYRRVLRGARPVTSDLHGVEAETITVHERMIAVMDVIASHETIEFERVFEVEGAPASRPVVVATFLAILELTRLEAIRIYQGVNEDLYPEGPIRLRRHEVPGADWSADIADIM